MVYGRPGVNLYMRKSLHLPDGSAPNPLQETFDLLVFEMYRHTLAVCAAPNPVARQLALARHGALRDFLESCNGLFSTPADAAEQVLGRVMYETPPDGATRT